MIKAYCIICIIFLIIMLSYFAIWEGKLHSDVLCCDTNIIIIGMDIQQFHLDSEWDFPTLCFYRRHCGMNPPHLTQFVKWNTGAVLSTQARHIGQALPQRLGTVWGLVPCSTCWLTKSNRQPSKQTTNNKPVNIIAM